MIGARTTVLAAAAVAMLAVVDAPLGDAETTLDTFRSLLSEKRALERQQAALQREARMAATKAPYIVFHLQERRFEFRIRGKTLKSYSFQSITLDERGRRPADPETVWRLLQEPLSVLEKEGGQPELLPPDPETGREAGLVYADPNQLAEQTGAKPQQTDAGVLGVDVPTDYYIHFEEKVVFHVRTPKELSFREKALDRLGMIAERMRAALPGGRRRDELERSARPRFELYLTTDPDTAKHLHYSLLPGEALVIAPPPPPPLVLIAAGRESGSGPRAASAR